MTQVSSKEGKGFKENGCKVLYTLIYDNSTCSYFFQTFVKVDSIVKF
jgi:hypothetical protein